MRALTPLARKVYRYQVQGPNALKVMEKVTGQAGARRQVLQHDRPSRSTGKTVRALRHGMVGQPGFELFGPSAEGDEVKAAIVEAGKDFGLRLSGARTYSSNTLESGWIPSPMPAIYSGEKMKSFRQWLPANTFEAIASLGGSFYSNNIEDYYLTPYDLGYGPVVKFDHDFIGREALEKIAQNPKRKKVTLVAQQRRRPQGHRYAPADGRARRSSSSSRPRSTRRCRTTRSSKDGKTIGVSTWCGYSSNERQDADAGDDRTRHRPSPATEVTFVWGEEGGGSQKPTVERHKQAEIRATVAPVPYADPARKDYRVNS